MNEFSLAEALELACLIEATARKPGNVHPGALFNDLTYQNFVDAAKISAPILAQAGKLGVGLAIRLAVEATVSKLGTNANLGICLLLAPLAAVPPEQTLSVGIRQVLMGLTVEDAREVYQAIRLANPGGMGEAPEQDLREEPTQTLLKVMQLAAERDGIAAEYAKNFQLVSMAALAWVKKFLHDFHQESEEFASEQDVPMTAWEYATIGLQLSLLTTQSDTLIRRKCGDALFHEAACRADYVLKCGAFHVAEGRRALNDLDRWLRADGHRRNPGTTADLIAAIWFIAIRDRFVLPPTKNEILEHAAQIQRQNRL